jgi:hypothetical protein
LFPESDVQNVALLFAAVIGVAVMVSFAHGEPDSSAVEAAGTTSKVADKSEAATPVLNAPAQ